MEFKIDDIFTSGMVLQHGQVINIFGSGENGHRISAHIQGQHASSVVENSKWLLKLYNLKISINEVLTITCESQTITLTDILIGDVYFLAGQSNMEFRFKDCDTAYEDIEKSNTCIRYYEVPKIEYEGHHVETSYNSGWQKCTQKNVQNFSAVGYYFADYLHHHKHIPLGLISINKGGTSASCWMSEHYLRKNKDIYKIYYEDYYASIVNQSDDEETNKRSVYIKQVSEYMYKVEMYKKENPNYSVNQLKQDIGHTPWPGPKGKKDFCRPSGLYYTMFKKACLFTAKAIIWYQGEEDVKYASMYEELLSLLIENWRNDMEENTPFLIVQLPEYNDNYGNKLSILREAQHHICDRLTACYLVVTMNCGEEFNIHPLNKKEVGRRIFQRVYELFYDSAYIGHSPRIVDVSKDRCIVIRFDQELYSDVVNEFEYVLSDRKLAVNGMIEGNKIILDIYPHVQSISYGYTNYTKIHIFGENGLPISPFKIDLTI